jgi:hypothetical protein
MQPIPASARAADPRWTVAFLCLAEGLIMAGAKAKIVERFTGLPSRRVKAMYKGLRGGRPPAGPVMQGSARFFAVSSKHTSEASRVQCSIFLACFECLGNITATPLNRGWRLLASFDSYLSVTEKLSAATSVKHLDINQAYALLAYCGSMTTPDGADIQRKRCDCCSIFYPVITERYAEPQKCPICAIDANCKRLSDLRRSSTRDD